MTVFLGILTFFVILAVLILVHELGHFTFAKVMGVRVEEFGLGFPPRAKGWRRGGTLYSLNWIPVGGFVKMLGENGEDAEPDSFGSQAPWRRLIILLAGPSMNLLLAVLIFFVAFANGSPQGLPIATKVQSNTPAARAGLRPGDTILALNGQRLAYLADLETVEQQHLGQRVVLTVRRGARRFKVSMVPRTRWPAGQGPMGIEMAKSVTVSYSPATAARMSVEQIGAMVASVPLLLASVSHHGGSGVAGPIGIAHITTNVVQNEPKQGPGSLLAFMALLSANLGVLNLLPVPALDGGRILFVLVAWVRRRNLDPEVEGLVHMVGMAVLLLLIVVVSYRDVVHWVTGGPF